MGQELIDLTSELETEPLSDCKVRSRDGRVPVQSPYFPDPSAHYLLDPPRPRPRFRSWIAVAIFAGILLALAIVAITS